jgi:hypothetical protein
MTVARYEGNYESRPWVFEMGDDGNTARIFRHSIYLNRIE